MYIFCEKKERYELSIQLSKNLFTCAESLWQRYFGLIIYIYIIMVTEIFDVQKLISHINAVHACETGEVAKES